jgi:hypothetical protein
MKKVKKEINIVENDKDEINESLRILLDGIDVLNVDQYDFINKFTKLSKKDIDMIINKFAICPYAHHYRLSDRFRILEKLYDAGYRFSTNNYMIILTKIITGYNKPKRLLKKVLANFRLDSFDELFKFILKVDDCTELFKYIDLKFYGEDKIDENLSYLYCLDYAEELETFVNEKNIQLTKKHLGYAKYAKDKDVIKFIEKYLETKKNNDGKSSDCKTLRQINNLFDCYTIEQMDDFIFKNKYEITPQTLILACKKNMDFDLITHLVMQKLIFDENQIDEIIESYCSNHKITKLLILLRNHGTVFSKKNFLKMLTSRYYYSIFSEKLGDNLVIDEDFINAAYDNIVKKNDSDTNIKFFLENIECIGNKNEKSAECVLALYCSLLNRIGGGVNIKRIKKLKKSFDIKLTNFCLIHLYKDKYNIDKEILTLFQTDGVIYDENIKDQVIKAYMTNKEYELYSILLKK